MLAEVHQGKRAPLDPALKIVKTRLAVERDKPKNSDFGIICTHFKILISLHGNISTIGPFAFGKGHPLFKFNETLERNYFI